MKPNEKDNWRQSLDESARLWRGGDESGAIKVVEEALDNFPENPLLRFQKHYMEAASRYKKGIPRIEMPEPGPDDPAVSVIMASRDRAHALRESIGSIVNQTFTGWELLLVNYGEGEKVKEIASRFEDPRIRCIASDSASMACALNAGLQNARGKYITFLDDDDIYYENHIETLINAMEANPRAVLAYSDSPIFYYPDNLMSLEGAEENSGYRRFLAENADKMVDYDREIYRSHVLFFSANVIIRREALADAGGFNEALSSGVDWELWLRLQGTGEFLRLPELAPGQKPENAIITSDTTHHLSHFYNIINTMNNEALLSGNSLKNRRGKKTIKALEKLLEHEPEMLDLINVKILLSENKPYRYFKRLAREFERQGNIPRKRALIKAAIRAAPYEVNLWSKLIRED